MWHPPHQNVSDMQLGVHVGSPNGGGLYLSHLANFGGIFAQEYS